MRQWHPLFAQLLRPLLESHYEIQTELPVGDAPRQADLVLLRRTTAGVPPFRGLWQWLTTWNVVEFKGPTVSARVDDLDALLELGLGIQRRLNEERTAQRQPRLEREEVSFWYLGNHLGRRFRAAAQDLVGTLEELAAGVWRGTVWQRPFLLVSNRAVAVERDSLPVHLLTTEPAATRQEVMRVLEAHPELWRSYAAWLASLHPAIVQELLRMGRRKGEVPTLDVRPLVQHLGWQEILRQTGLDDLIAQVGLDNLIARVGLDNLVAHLNATQREELLRLLQATPPPEARRPRRR